MLTRALLLVGAYFLGAIPTGQLIARARGKDLRAVGSGNIGATNATRALGKGWGAVVLILDALKGFVPAWLSARLVIDHAQILPSLAGAFAVLGHCTTPFLRFKGGKGVATGFGAYLGLAPLAALAGLGGYVLGLAIGRASSIGSLVGVTVVPIMCVVLAKPPAVSLAALGVWLVVVARHHENLRKIARGEEGFGRRAS